MSPLRRICFTFMVTLLVSGLGLGMALAVNPDEMLKNPKLEARARELSSILRCMKCQNQSIDNSDADLARDIRILIRERLTKGDSDRQVLDYLVDRYGEFVLLKPSFSLSNLFLWATPFLALIAGIFLFARNFLGRKLAQKEGVVALTDGEHDQLTKILDERD